MAETAHIETFFSLTSRGGIREDRSLQRTHIESALVVTDAADDPANFFRPQFPAVAQSKAIQLSLFAEQHGSLNHVRSRDRPRLRGLFSPTLRFQVRSEAENQLSSDRNQN